MELSKRAKTASFLTSFRKHKIIVLAALIGMAQGLVGWIVTALWPGKTVVISSFLTERSTLLPLFYFVFAGGLCAQLLLKNKPEKREWGMAIGTGLLFALMAHWSLSQLILDVGEGRRYTDGSSHIPSIALLFLLLAYVLIPYLQAWRGRVDGRFQYHDLYRHSWDNFFIVSVGLLLAAIYWLLIVLGCRCLKFSKSNCLRIFSTAPVLSGSAS